ncbi:MAG: hypothetical protein NTV34_03320, partial [Proteobacteria bacterium]|nr:hypothetical protein [Pseudomonadota bacterium]
MKSSIHKRIKTLIFATGLSYGGMTFANDKGNGGDVVVCRDQMSHNIQTVEFFDITEARSRQIAINLGVPELDPIAKVTLAINDLKARSPIRGAFYQSRLDDFFKPTNAEFIVGQKLVDVPDAGPVVLPENCEIEQLVVLRQRIFPEDTHGIYTFNKTLWDHLDNNSKAAAILHEIVYREFIEFAEHEDSVLVRYYNSYLFSRKITSLSSEDFIHLHMRVKSGYIDLNGILAQIGPLSADYFVQPKQNESAPYAFIGHNLLFANVLTWDNAYEKFNKDCPMQRDRDLRAACVRKKMLLPEMSFITVEGHKVAVTAFNGNSHAMFYVSNGGIRQIAIAREQADYHLNKFPSLRLPVNDLTGGIDIRSCGLSYGQIKLDFAYNGM